MGKSRQIKPIALVEHVKPSVPDFIIAMMTTAAGGPLIANRQRQVERKVLQSETYIKNRDHGRGGTLLQWHAKSLASKGILSTPVVRYRRVLQAVYAQSLVFVCGIAAPDRIDRYRCGIFILEDRLNQN
ncbi:hypothetical protein EVAR_90767_1 [Eumeta japonica]|uniref:Uncharacterized protein n=1 Tax=Eumeta variegata TaxID=151549 RepID=A0A4C1YJ21_EUMVA|nr:hypothetical protein EVAR_90767_1 [Eumeta japonica]